MKLRYPLYAQTLAMLMLYLGTLAGITLLCFNAQFGIGWETALRGPLGERYESIAGAISSQLHSSKPKKWPEILQSFEDIYHVKFYVFDQRGNQLAGENIELPAKVEITVTEPPPPVGMGPGGPHGPRRGHGPGLERGPGLEGGPGLNRGPGPDFDRGPGPDFDRGRGPDGGPGGPWMRPGMQPPDQFLLDMPPPPPPDGFDPRGPHPDGFGMPPEPPDEFFGRAHHRFIVHTTNPDKFWIGAYIHVFSPAAQHSVPGVLIAASDNLWQSNLLFDSQFALTLFAGILIFSLLFWWPFVYRITNALTTLTKATESIAEGKFDTRVNSGGADEIGRLSEAVDTMAEHLEGYVQEQKRLLADISHELFSPLARLQMALELLESSSDKDQSGHIKDIREEVEEMNELITELIAYSKAGMQAKTRELVTINLLNTVEALVPKFAGASKVKIDIPGDCQVLADQLLLDRAIGNILRNSVRYAGTDGQITITTTGDNATVTLSICDDGPGVSEDAIKHLGQPFYRPEASRNRSSGGFGLGLTIVKSCVEACKGTLTIRNLSPHGLAVDLRLEKA